MFLLFQKFGKKKIKTLTDSPFFLSVRACYIISMRVLENFTFLFCFSISSCVRVFVVVPEKKERSSGLEVVFGGVEAGGVRGSTMRGEGLLFVLGCSLKKKEFRWGGGLV